MSPREERVTTKRCVDRCARSIFGRWASRCTTWSLVDHQTTRQRCEYVARTHAAHTQLTRSATYHAKSTRERGGEGRDFGKRTKNGIWISIGQLQKIRAAALRLLDLVPVACLSNENENENACHLPYANSAFACRAPFAPFVRVYSPSSAARILRPASKANVRLSC